jgi:hypothetical protein
VQSPSATRPGCAAVHSTATGRRMRKKGKALFYTHATGLAVRSGTTAIAVGLTRMRVDRDCRRKAAGCRAYQTGKCLFRLRNGLFSSAAGCNLFVLSVGAVTTEVAGSSPSSLG